MRNGWLLLFVVLLLSGIVCSQSAPVVNDSLINDSLSKVTPKISQVQNVINGSLSKISIPKDDIFSRALKLPEQYRLLYLLLGFFVESDHIIVGTLLLFLVICVGVFVTFLEVLEFTSFETSWVKMLLASGMLLILMVTGGIWFIAQWLNDLVVSSFSVSYLKAFLIILVIIVLFSVINRYVKKQKRLTLAKAKGEFLGSAINSTIKADKDKLDAVKE